MLAFATIEACAPRPVYGDPLRETTHMVGPARITAFAGEAPALLDGFVLRIRGTFPDGVRHDFDVTFDAAGQPRRVTVQGGTDPSRVAAMYPGVAIRHAEEE